MRWRRSVLLRPGPRRALHHAKSPARKAISAAERFSRSRLFAWCKARRNCARRSQALGCPCVLKTADFGYDGKGQQKIDLRDRSRRGVETARLPTPACLRRGCRSPRSFPSWSARGQMLMEDEEHQALAFPPTVNEHENHILATSVAPAPLADSILARAQSIACADREGARRHRAARGRIFPDEARRPARERTRAAPPQLRPLQLRCLRHEPVRAAIARGLRPAARRHAAAVAGADAQSARRCLGQRHAGLERPARAARTAAASLRQKRAARRPQDGPLLRR